MNPTGYFALVLHAHLPFVRHPEYERFLEEDWFFEALTETYLPLLEIFENLRSDGVHFRITMSLTPTLLSMMTDPLLQQRYVSYLDTRLAALEIERTRTAGDQYLGPVVEYYQKRFNQLRAQFVDRYQRDVVQPFRSLLESGQLEIITCGATHGYFPLLATHEESIYAQLSMAIRTHQRILGHRPTGIWLPECGYIPGIDRILAEFGIDFFFLDSHGILGADPPPRHGVYCPVRTPSGPAAFGRDYESSKQVWSAEEGYPGDPVYREFYRDAGFDVDAPHIETLRHAGIKTFTGLKYHRITGRGDWKEAYHPEWARDRAAAHADNFLFNRQHQVRWLNSQTGRPPIIVAPYDAELFGHWWYEGPQWIDFLFRKMAYDQDEVRAITAAEFLRLGSDLETVVAPECSWGAGGYHEVWLNGTNDWIYPLLFDAGERMSRLVSMFPDAKDTHRWILDQAARELLLAQSSDWAFIMKTGTSVEYADRRIKTHLHRFDRLANMLESGHVDHGYLEAIAERDSLFPDMDYRIFSKRPCL